MSFVINGWKFWQKRGSDSSLEQEMPPLVRVIHQTSSFHFVNMVHSVNRIVTWVDFKPAHFPKFSPTDLERLKDDGRWLSDSHVTLCLRLVPFPFFKFINLINADIVFWIVSIAVFGGSEKLNSWTRHSGKS